MASFEKKTAYRYPQANIIEVLKPNGLLRRRASTGTYQRLNNDGNGIKSGQETWQVAFSPDESFFAWSCGNQYVVLVPLIQQYPDKQSSCDNELNKNIITQQRRLDCGSTVFSVAFGSSTSNHQYESNSGCWSLHKFTKDLILATGLQNGSIRIWDVYAGRLLLKLMDHTGSVRDVSFAPDGSLRLASASHDTTVKIWDLKDEGNMGKTFRGQNFMFRCSWSPDAKKLACVGKCRTVFVWDMTTYEMILKLNGHLNSISSCTFSPDGSVIVTASYDTQVIIWDSETGKMLRKLGHLFPRPSLIYASGENGTWVRDVSFSKDGCHIATVADDGYLRFWDLTDCVDEDPVEVASIDKALCCSYSPSGQTIAVGRQR